MRLSDHESESVLPREGWILYDGGCGFCFRWVHLWKKVVRLQVFKGKTPPSDDFLPQMNPTKTEPTSPVVEYPALAREWIPIHGPTISLKRSTCKDGDRRAICNKRA